MFLTFALVILHRGGGWEGEPPTVSHSAEEEAVKQGTHRNVVNSLAGKAGDSGQERQAQWSQVQTVILWYRKQSIGTDSS